MSDYKQPAISTIGVQHEQEHALIDARDFIWERGEQIEIRLFEENTVERDDFNSIKKKKSTVTKLTFYAYPITFNPTEEELRGTGLKERCQAVVYTAMLDWNDNSYTLENLRKIDLTRVEIVVRGARYEIKDKALNSQFSDTFLYVVLGVNRK